MCLACGSLFGVRCSLFVGCGYVCCLLFAVRCLLFVVRCSLTVDLVCLLCNA